MAAVEGAARQTGSYLTHHSRADDAIRELDHREWRAVLVDITTPGASRFCHEARARRALFNVPLLGMTPQLTDLAFSNAFRWGADDVVPLGLSAPVVARLAALPEAPPAPDPARGEAIVGDADRGRCDVIGRVLANAGYAVRYATDLVSARYYLAKKGVTLFVINEELADPPALIEEARTHGNTASWVITAKQRNIDETRDALRGVERVAVMSAHGPPENVLFALDFLNPSRGAARRAQVRALYGTMVFFRSEGEEEDQCGYTYSVSGNGLYVRTLLPAPAGRLWIEIEPPKAARRVRLLGEVAWSRTFGQGGAETAPPGFGVRLTSGLGEDLELWVSGFHTLEGAKPDPHVVPEVKFTPQPFRVPLPASLSQAPRASFVSRASQPIIAVTETRPSRPPELPLATVPAPPPVATTPPPPETAEPQTLPILEEATARRSDGPPKTPASIARMLDALTPMPVTADRAASIDPEVPADVELGPADATPAPADATLAPKDSAPSEPIAAGPPPKPIPPEDAPYQGVPDKVTTLGAVDADSEPGPARRSHSEAALAESVRTDAKVTEPEARTPTPAAPVALEPLELAEPAPVPPPAGKTQRAQRPRRAVWVLGAAVLVVSVVWAARPPEAQRPSREGVAAATASPSPGPTAAARSAGTPETGAPTLPVGTVEASLSEPDSSPPPASVQPAETRERPESAPPDAGTLAEDECWLRVTSDADATVFVHGIDVGRTNQWLRSRCGFRFIRLGAAPGQWLSEGTPHRLPCREAVTIAVGTTETSEPVGVSEGDPGAAEAP